MYDGYITWRELESWKNINDVDLDPWEASTIIELSKAYFQQREMSKNMATLCPWPTGRNMWNHVQTEKYRKEREAEEERLKTRK